MHKKGVQTHVGSSVGIQVGSYVNICMLYAVYIQLHVHISENADTDVFSCR